MNVMQLIEKLKEVDPLTPVVISEEDMEIGYHFKEIKMLENETVRMTEIRCIDAFDGTRFTTRQLMSCSKEKPNAFRVLVLR